MYKYAIFIPTYKRADNVITYKTLLKCNYKGDVYFIVSDDDVQIKDYIKNFGEKVIIFSKDKARPETDLCDNFENKNLVVYARNFMFKIAKHLELDCFCVLDDDYEWFSYRKIFGNVLKEFKVKNIDKIIIHCFNYLMKTPNLDCFS